MTPLGRVLMATTIVVLVALAWTALRGFGPLSVRGDVVLSAGPYGSAQPCGGDGTLRFVRGGGTIYVGATDVEGPVAQGTLHDGVSTDTESCHLHFEIGGVPRGFEEYRLLVLDSDQNIVGMTAHLREPDLALSQTVAVNAKR